MSEDVTARLAEITANLSAYIEERAQEIAAPRIAAAEDEADEKITKLMARHAFEVQRLEDLTAELRRQIQPAVTYAERYGATVRKLRTWVTSDVVTSKNEFGNGYREAMRDVQDVLNGGEVRG